MFQRDYWRLSDEELEKHAEKYHVPPWSRSGPNNENVYVDRDRIIRVLVERDNALRTKVTTVLSILALLLSIGSLLNSYRTANLALPTIQVKEDTVAPGPVWDQARHRWRYFAYNRFLISNTGGRSTSFVGLRSHEFPPLLLVGSGSSVTANHKINVALFPMQEYLADIQRDPSVVTRYEEVPLEKLQLLNVPIGPGETVIFTLGVLIDAYDQEQRRLAEQLLFAIELNFADGSSHLFRAAFTVPEKP